MDVRVESNDGGGYQVPPMSVSTPWQYWAIPMNLSISICNLSTAQTLLLFHGRVSCAILGGAGAFSVSLSVIHSVEGVIFHSPLEINSTISY